MTPDIVGSKKIQNIDYDDLLLSLMCRESRPLQQMNFSSKLVPKDGDNLWFSTGLGEDLCEGGTLGPAFAGVGTNRSVQPIRNKVFDVRAQHAANAFYLPHVKALDMQGG